MTALLTLAFSAAPAAACSVVPGYRVPTNLELADRADTILIGTVEGFSQGTNPWERQARIRPTLLLKGAALPAQISIEGYPAEALRRPTRSNPRELHEPNPDALIGGCTRYLFEPGMKLVLFFERGKDGQLRFASYPFARVSEDVPSDEAPWIKAVRIYVEVAALPRSQRKAAMRARRDALRAATGDPDAALVADDIDRELGSKRTRPYD